jgi:bifunctional non-homologous end joining protein LigD
VRLRDDREKRDFERTPEPAGRTKKASARSRRSLRFVVQKHDASRLHYDFRLEMEGVLRSWAVPKGPSLDTRDRRLAVEVEDHPLDYGTFEGTIPKGEYGGGTVLLWDRGTWLPDGDPVAAWNKGHIEFELRGEKLRGQWKLVRLRDREGRDGRANWLLIKRSDDEARPRSKGDILVTRPESVATGRDLAEITTGKRGAETKPCGAEPRTRGPFCPCHRAGGGGSSPPGDHSPSLSPA